jgi:hypothetical protein
LPPQRPGTPAPPGGSVEHSAIADAIVNDNPTGLDLAIANKYRQIVNPKMGKGLTTEQQFAQNSKILTGMDAIIDDRAKLRLMDMQGRQVPLGSPKQTLQQSFDALSQSLKLNFGEYNNIANASSKAGTRLSLAPAVQLLESAANDKALLGAHPGIGTTLRRFAENWKGDWSPNELQNLISNLNEGIKIIPGTRPNPEDRILVPIVSELRGILDNGIGALGPEYRAFKNKYGALRSMQKDLANAVVAKAPPGALDHLANIVSLAEVGRAGLTSNPIALADAVLIKGGQTAWRMMNSPNKAMARLFQQRMRSRDIGNPPPPPGAIRSGLGVLPSMAAPGAGFEEGRRSALRKPGDIGPLGGTVTNSYSAPPSR